MNDHSPNPDKYNTHIHSQVIVVTTNAEKIRLVEQIIGLVLLSGQL